MHRKEHQAIVRKWLEERNRMRYAPANFRRLVGLKKKHTYDDNAKLPDIATLIRPGKMHDRSRPDKARLRIRHGKRVLLSILGPANAGLIFLEGRL